MKKFLPYLIILAICFPIIFSLLKPGFYTSDDGEWAVVRFGAFHRALKDGQFPPRWADNLFHGYGYPVLNFNYPLPYYLAEVFHLFLGFVVSIKAVFIFSVIASGFSFYLLARSLSATTLYLYFPFRLLNLYHRGSIGESLSLVFIPLCFYFLKKKRFFLLALSLAALILSHNVVALISFPFLLIYGFKQIKNFSFLKGIILGLLLSLFFWLPALWEKNITNLGAGLLGHPTEYFNLPVPLGLVTLLAIAAIILFRFKEKIFILFGLSISLFMMSSISSWVYYLPLVNFIGYPWRFLHLVGFFTAWGLALILHIPGMCKSLIRGLFLIIIIPLITYFQFPHLFKPKEFVNRSDDYYLTNQATTISADENTPLWVKDSPTHQPDQKIELVGDFEIISKKSNLLKADLNLTQDQVVKINTIYYPGWKIFLNEQELPSLHLQDQMGRISFQAPVGEHHLELKFTETPFRLICNLISFLTFFYILYSIFKTLKSNA
ncbi:hypothetical protein ISS86_01905 [Candidatus Microgenomates bacterium]|nr:hypothetical protein [Candidatus Microgenomates bacterium]